MSRGSIRYRHLLTVAAGGLAVALVVAPVQFESGDLLPSKSTALADKGGEANGGNSGDRGKSGEDHGKSGGGGESSSSSSGGGGGGNGPSTGDDNPGGGFAFGAGGHNSHIGDHPGRGFAFGRGGHTSHNIPSSDHNPGVPGPNFASVIKWFNAAHANLNALLNAAPNSRVGLIAAYFRNAESTLDAPANSDALADLTDTRDDAAALLAAAQIVFDASA